MNGTTITIVLRLIHILAGAFWVGAIIFMTVFLMPTLRAIGPAGGPVMQQLVQVRRLPIYMMGAPLLTVLSGVTLYWRDSNGIDSAWLHSGTGRMFGLGGLLAIVAVVLGMTIVSPSAKRMGALAAAIQGAGRPPSPEQVAEVQQLQSRLSGFMAVVMVLVVLAAATMAIARYML